MYTERYDPRKHEPLIRHWAEAAGYDTVDPGALSLHGFLAVDADGEPCAAAFGYHDDTSSVAYVDNFFCPRGLGGFKLLGALRQLAARFVLEATCCGWAYLSATVVPPAMARALSAMGFAVLGRNATVFAARIRKEF